MNGLIIDVAHGKNTPGKRSPDGKHREYLWSRNQARKLMSRFNSISRLPFDYHCPFLDYENEPGLTFRVQTYNEIAKAHDQTFMLSLHNDASRKKGWDSPHGMALWTSKGDTDADIYATFKYNKFREMMPYEHFRTAYWDIGNPDPDYEANFTVIAGNKRVVPEYDGVLFEVLFQNNRDDVEKLLDPTWNDNFNNTLRIIITQLFVQIINR